MLFKACVSSLYKKKSGKQLEGHCASHDRKPHSVTFGKVASFIEETVMNAIDKIPKFKLSDFADLKRTGYKYGD